MSGPTPPTPPGSGGAPKQPTIFPMFLSTPGQGSFLTSTFNVLSFYAPIIIIAGVFILSVFSASVGKTFVFMFWFFVARRCCV